ncbi:MAG TPA: hypothetical protein VGS23_03690 [Thermoplasmata archaeon]|nr:hypothetical protein [Thermoplasmata archaeon]
MVEESELEVNVLEFHHKSFSFERVVDWDGVDLALFHRTETESESQFRPRLLRLTLVVPRSWLSLDPAEGELRLAQEGRAGAPRAPGTATEAAAESSRFEEQGRAWRRHALGPGGFLYVPEPWADRLLSKSGLSRLGFGGA